MLCPTCLHPSNVRRADGIAETVGSQVGLPLGSPEGRDDNVGCDEGSATGDPEGNGDIFVLGPGDLPILGSPDDNNVGCEEGSILGPSEVVKLGGEDGTVF